MAVYATKKDVESIVRTAVDDLSEVISALAQNMRTELVDIKYDVVDVRRSIDRPTNTIDGFVKRLDDMEVDNTVRNAQYHRLLKWAQKTTAKTGIPIEL